MKPFFLILLSVQFSSEEQEERQPLILDQINPELKKKISCNLLGDPESLIIQEEIGKGKKRPAHKFFIFFLQISHCSIDLLTVALLGQILFNNS